MGNDGIDTDKLTMLYNTLSFVTYVVTNDSHHSSIHLDMIIYSLISVWRIREHIHICDFFFLRRKTSWRVSFNRPPKAWECISGKMQFTSTCYHVLSLTAFIPYQAGSILSCREDKQYDLDYHLLLLDIISAQTWLVTTVNLPIVKKIMQLINSCHTEIVWVQVYPEFLFLHFLSGAPVPRHF